MNQDNVAGSDRKVLVPSGAAQLDDDDDRVLVIGISAEQFSTLPEYRQASFDRDYEASLLSGRVAVPREARVTRSEEELSIGKRRVQAGEVEERIDVDDRVRTKSSRAAIDRAIDEALGDTNAR
jgi:stress response protein YsnF